MIPAKCILSRYDPPRLLFAKKFSVISSTWCGEKTGNASSRTLKVSRLNEEPNCSVAVRVLHIAITYTPYFLKRMPSRSI